MDRISLSLLLLIMVANGAPVLGAALFGRWAAWPLDGGLIWWDGRPLLGPSKTWRGVFLALIATTIMAWLMRFPPNIGVIIGACAMLGDLLSSFIKRRLGMPSSSQAFGLDQIPEALLPLLAVRDFFHLKLWNIGETIVGFIVLELLLSRILYRFRVRKRPY